MPNVILPTGEPLVGRDVRLDPLTEDDLGDLAEVLQDPEIYAGGYVLHRRPTSAQDALEVARDHFLALHGNADGRGGGRTSYAIRLVADSELGTAGTMIGTSSLLEANLHHERIRLGKTLYGRPWWGTAVNPETKLLLLTHCFDTCGYGRVKFQMDASNTRSRAAVASIGARHEGTLRRESQRADGTFRDTVVFSVIRDEWPEVKLGLHARLRERMASRATS